MTHSLTLSTRLDRPHIPRSGGFVNVLIQLHAASRDADARLPLNLAAVLDRSGSMAGAKLTYTKEALLFLVDQMAAHDRLAAVVYDTRVETLLPNQPVVHKDPLKAMLRRIEPGGSTNLSGGLATGMQQIAPHAGPDFVSRTLLLTDGLANVGVTDPETLVGWVKAWREQGLGLTTIGVGDDFSEDLLVAMAEAGGGSFHYIDNPDQIPAIFAAELSGLLQVVAQGLQLRLRTAPGAAIEAVVGYPPSGTPQEVVLTLPDLYGGEIKSLLVRLAVAAPPADGTIAHLSLSYLPAAPGAGPETLSTTVSVAATDDATLLAAPPDEEVTRQLNLAEAAVAREEAVRLADQGDLQGGAQRLAQAANLFACLASAGNDYAAEQAAALRREAELLQNDHYDQAVRKQMRQQSHRARQGRPPR